MMSTDDMLAAIKEMPAFATTAKQQIGCALDDIIAASKHDPATHQAAWHVRKRITALLATRGKHANFQQLVTLIDAVRRGEQKGGMP